MSVSSANKSIRPVQTAGIGCRMAASLKFAGALLAASAMLTDPVGAIETEPNDCLSDVTGTLSASPSVVGMGGSTTLSWSVTVPGGCGSVTQMLHPAGMVPVGGTVARNGSTLVTPQTNANTWILRAKRSGLTVSLATVSITTDTTGYTTVGTPLCDSAQISRHDRIRSTQHAIDVIDPDGFYIGSSEGDGELWRNWEPVDQYKHALCGTQDHYGFYVGPWYGYAGEEADSNKHIIPGAPFLPLIDDAISFGYSDPEAVKDCHGSRCMEAEITPDENDAGNPWFPHQSGPSPLDGKALCVYGPWIADHGHGGRPEIHPSEAHWWPTQPTPAGLLSEWRVLLMQDDSNRFDEREDDFTPDMPASIKPWSAAPRTAHIRHAFLVPQSGGPEQFLHVWNPSRFRNVTTPLQDVTNGTRHTLKFNGVPRFTIVEEPGILEQNLSVGFDDNLSASGAYDVCRRTDGTLQGYALLRSRFGLNNSGGEGFHEVLLRHSNSPSDSGGAVQVAEEAKRSTEPTHSPLLRTNADFDTLRVVQSTNGIRLIGDLIVTLVHGASIADALDGRGAKVAIAPQRKQQGVNANSNTNEVRLRDLDLSSGSELQATFQNGEIVKGRLPGLGVAAHLEARPQRQAASTSELDAAWSAVLASIGAKTVPRPSAFSHLASWTITATPQFAAMKDGRVSSEDVYEVASLLNRGNDQSILALAKAISNVSWRDGKRNAVSGVDELAHTAVFQSASVPASRRIALTLNDAFGGQVERNLYVQSHGLFQMDAKALTELIATMAGVDAGLLVTPDPKAVEPPSSSLASARGLLSQLLARSARDEVITPDELRAQVLVARRLADH